METAEQVTVRFAEMEQRAVRVNGALLRMRLAINSGNLETIANQQALVQELNWTNCKALLAAGAPDSILQSMGLAEYGPPDDDDLPQGEDYDLAALGGLPMDAPEEER